MSVTVNFFLNKHKKYAKAKELSIAGRVSYQLIDANGIKQKRQFRITTGCAAPVGKFAGNRVKPSVTGASLVNSKLSEIEDKAQELYNQYSRAGSFPEPETFKAQLVRGALSSTESREFLRDFASYIEAKAGVLSHKGVYNLRQAYTHIYHFGKRKKYALTYATINKHFLTLFTAYCLKDEDIHRPAHRKDYYKVKLQHNTIRKYVKGLVAFLNYATENGWTQHKLYKGFLKVMPELPTEIIALTSDEIDRIYNLDLTGKTELFRLCRDYFVLATEIGTRISDYGAITHDNFTRTPTGLDLRIIQKKLAQRYGIMRATTVVPVSLRVLNIFERYNYKLPKPPIGKTMNKNLKVIAELAGVEKSITSHTARKTFCSTMYRAGIPVNYIMKLSGHTTEGSFYKYVGVGKEENAETIRGMLPNKYKLDSSDFLKAAK